MCLEVIVYKELEVITESTSPDRRLSGLSAHICTDTSSDMAVYTGVHSPKQKKLPVIFAFDF